MAQRPTVVAQRGIRPFLIPHPVEPGLGDLGGLPLCGDRPKPSRRNHPFEDKVGKGFAEEPIGPLGHVAPMRPEPIVLGLSVRPVSGPMMGARFGNGKAGDGGE